MENDLIIVKITQTEHRGVQEAASGDWVVASDKARYFTRLVAVGQKNIELGVFEIVGHTDVQRIKPELLPRFPDNHALGLARANQVGRYLTQQLGLPESAYTADSRGPDEPLATPKEDRAN